MEKGLQAQMEMAVMRTADGKVDQKKIDDITAQAKLVSEFKQGLLDVLEIDRSINDAKHEQAMAMETAKLTRDFETNQTEKLLKNEAKRIKNLEAQKALKVAEVAQAALGEAATEDQIADAAENVRLAQEKVDLTAEELRIQKLLTTEEQKRASIAKAQDQVKALKKYSTELQKLMTDRTFAGNPFFSQMSKGTKGAISRRLDPGKAERDYNMGVNAARGRLDTVANADNVSTQQLEIAKKQYALDIERLTFDKTQAELSEAQRAVNAAAGAGGAALEKGMTTGLMSVAKGEKKAKDAAAEVALGVAEAIMQSLIQSLVSNLLGDLLAKLVLTTTVETQNTVALGALSTMIGLNTSAVAANTIALQIGSFFPGGRRGGVFDSGRKVSGYSAGGIANGSTSGYGAILHGREAVIPVPSGDKIPVEVKGGTMTNSVVNVTVNSDGSSSMDAEKANAFGKGIQAAVQQEISKQQRFGGLLSGK